MRRRAETPRTQVAREDDFLAGDGGGRDDKPVAAGSRTLAAAREIDSRRVIAAAVVVVVLVVAGLAVGGVFSSGKKAATSPPTTPTSPTTTTQRRVTTTTATTAAHRLPVPAAPLKPSDQGAQVKVLQRALAQLGYKPGAIDGDYGSSTQAAVVSFQKASKLFADGISGPATLKALKTALLSSG